MSSACRTSDGGGGGLEVLNHANEDVLFLTPNQDQEEEDYEEKLETKEPEEVSFDTQNAHDLYTNQAQISLIVDASDITDDLNDNKTDLQANGSEDVLTNNDSNHKADLNGVSEENQNSHSVDNNKDDNNGNGLEASNDQTANVENKSNVDDGVMSEMKYLFKNTRYFLIKSNNFENIDLAKQKGVWSTPKINEIKLNKAYRECANVLLIFSVSESGRFQGYARLSSECIRDDDLQVNWILPPTLSARSLNGVFKIDWVTKNDLFFTKCAYINNPWNENKPVKVGRDGQEIEPHAGELLCRQFDLGIASTEGQTDIPAGVTEHLDAILSKSKKRHEELVNEKEQQKSRHSDQDRDRRHRDRSSDRNGRSDERRNSSDRSRRDSDSSKQRENTSGSSHQNSSGYHQGNQQVFSHKRNYHDGNHYRNYNDPSQRRYNNYQNGNNNFPYQQYPNSNMRNMNPYQQQQQQFYNQQMHPNQPMYNGNIPNMHHGMNQYQQPMQNNMHHMNMMYPQNQQVPPYHNDRNNNSSPKKQRMSNDFMPATKDIILKSQTYEEYLAAASTIQSQSVFDRLGGEPTDPTQYVNYDALAQNRNTSSSSSSKYEQEVEEFLRKTAGIPSQSSSSHSRYKSDEKSSSSRSHEKKSSSRDKDRDSYRRDRDRDSHRRDHRHGSHSSQERSTRRRSRDRK